MPNHDPTQNTEFTEDMQALAAGVHALLPPDWAVHDAAHNTYALPVASREGEPLCLGDMPLAPGWLLVASDIYESLDMDLEVGGASQSVAPESDIAEGPRVQSVIIATRSEPATDPVAGKYMVGSWCNSEEGFNMLCAGLLELDEGGSPVVDLQQQANAKALAAEYFGLESVNNVLGLAGGALDEERAQRLRELESQIHAGTLFLAVCGVAPFGQDGQREMLESVTPGELSRIVSAADPLEHMPFSGELLQTFMDIYELLP